ncbi:hypothetical protein EYR40_006688 [Pleurotus pulmonarius]|nr:hypothetical protein EYR36_011308 [Pleurotus pulmonarius]KAF4599592.1 hypothetical protein EYR40_006688 [Pleurotus pulmonarius]
MSLVVPEQHQQFQHILRLLNTNVDGKRKVMYALTEIKGVGRRYANLVCKKADVDLNKRAGELNSDELERIVTIIQNPTQFKIPTWFLNRQKDIVDGKNSQILSNGVDSKLRDDLERLKKIRAHRGLRHFWGLRVRGQHTKTTGRRGKTVEENRAAKEKSAIGVMTTWISQCTPSTHPWFANASMKRKFPSSTSSSSPSSTPTQSDSDSNPGNPHRPKRRRCSTLEKGLSYLSLDANAWQRDSNVGHSQVRHPHSTSPDVSASQLPDISEMTPTDVYQSRPDVGADAMQFDIPAVVRPSRVDEPGEHTPPIVEINMKSSSWYEPEPDRTYLDCSGHAPFVLTPLPGIVVTDLDSSEDEADVEDNPILLPPSILKHIAARNLEMMKSGGKSMHHPDDAGKALVLFRPLSLGPPSQEEGDADDDSTRDTDTTASFPSVSSMDDDDAMDIE